MTFELADMDGVRAERVLDLRGRAAAGAHAVGVLEDPSGRRRVRIRWLGRASGAFFSVWLSALVLAGLGVIPRGVVPLADVLTPASDAVRGGSGLQTPATRIGPAAPARDGATAERPSRDAASRTSRVARDRAASSSRPRGGRVGVVPRRAPRAGLDRPRRGGISAPRHGTRPGGSTTPAAPGRTGSSPSQTAAPGQAGSTPGQTAAPGRTGSTPGQTTARGRTGSTPGQTAAPGQTGSTPGQTTAPGQTGSTPRSAAVRRTETVPPGSGQAGERSPMPAGGSS